jgi:hypothetical protein
MVARAKVYNGSVNCRVALPGTLLLFLPQLWAQTGTAHIRVTASDGSGIPGAKISLSDHWGRTLATSAADGAGEFVWKHLPLADAYFYAQAPGFYPAAAAIRICDHALEHTIVLQLAKVPEWERRNDVVIVDGANPHTIDMVPMPTCQALDLSSTRPKPAVHH